MTILKTYIVLAQLEKLLPTEKDAESVKSILIYFLALLLGLIFFGGRYLIKQNNQRFTDKDAIITEKENTNVALQLKYDAELKYSKEQDKANVKLLTDTGNILESSVKKLENNSDILRDNSEVLRNIKDLQMEIDNKIKSINLHKDG